MKPWREIAVPHSDVLKGTFQQAEFAADISAVRAGKAPAIYTDAVLFFERTFITEGMRDLLVRVVQRLAGVGGDPVIQLQTAFGGGKTHTMLAVWHIAARTRPLSELAGVSAIIERADALDVPPARVAVLDGTNHSPGQPWTNGATTVRTLWGELAWQLGGAEAFALVAADDTAGTAPGKDALRSLLERHSPCAVLLDELVAYVRQFPDGKQLSGGTYDANLSFIQNLTEAAKLAPRAVLLASLPESDIEAGERGARVLRALEKIFGRVQALWKPVGSEESFEIVRRRLFEPIRDEAARDAVCRAFAKVYADEGARLPGEVREGRYLDRMQRAYPIHPEVFDRLYTDWSTIDGFQRTRGVLKLMARVIARLWKAENRDLLILPSSLPLADANVRNEMTYLLPPGWDPVIENDIDGDRAETTRLEASVPRFGQWNAAQRVARTLFFGTAPSSVALAGGVRGLDRARVLLGCLQPEQQASVYVDVLTRVAERMHYLSSAGATEEETRYWFSTRANLRREMEDRRGRIPPHDEERRIEAEVRDLFRGQRLFDGVHTFSPLADVPDASALRLVLLAPRHPFTKELRETAERAVHEYLGHRGGQPRQRANRLLFVAADQVVLGRLRDAVRTALAWRSIVEDVENGSLNIDQAQARRAKSDLAAADAALPRVARECYKWLLCPTQEDPRAARQSIEAFALDTAAGTPSAALERLCRENELVIEKWSPVHLRALLAEFYWKPDAPHVGAKRVWEDAQRYVYLPRLRSLPALTDAITLGAASVDFFGTALGVAGDEYQGFQFGRGATYVDTLVLIEPGAARAYERSAEEKRARRDAEAQAPRDAAQPTAPSPAVPAAPPSDAPSTAATQPPANSTNVQIPLPVAGKRKYLGIAEINAALAKSQLNTIAEEIIALLTRNPNAVVNVTIEIDAAFDDAAPEDVRRSVSENARTLKFKTNEWE